MPTPPSEIRLVIVIPVYGNWDDTAVCLRQFAEQSETRFEVLVADDESPALPPREVTAWPFVTYLRGPNLGFAGNCNRAAEKALAMGATHLLFLNNDTEFGQDFVKGWLRVAESRQQGLVSPLIYWHSAKESVWYSGGPKSIFVPFMRLQKEYRSMTEVDVLCGCTLLAPAEMWRVLRGFDERYSLYFEDFDLTLRARARHIRCYVDPDPDLRVWHRVSGSFRGAGAWKQEYRMLASRLLFVRSHYTGLTKAICLALGCLHLAIVWCWNLPELPELRKLARAIQQGAQAEAGVRS